MSDAQFVVIDLECDAVYGFFTSRDAGFVWAAANDLEDVSQVCEVMRVQ